MQTQLGQKKDTEVKINKHQNLLKDLQSGGRRRKRRRTRRKRRKTKHRRRKRHTKKAPSLSQKTPFSS